MSQSSSNMIDLLQAGIRVEGYRQQAIASNIANIETPGYRRIDVKFENLLAKALKTSGNVDLSEIEPESFHPENTPVKSNGNDVSLDMEVGELLKNSLRHTAYVRILNRRLQQIEQAINIR